MLTLCSALLLLIHLSSQNSTSCDRSVPKVRTMSPETTPKSAGMRNPNFETSISYRSPHWRYGDTEVL
jgi:hypothetical protein